MTATDDLTATDRALLDGLAASPNVLAPDYGRFRVTERLLLTGHSHQAWPDVARDGLVAAFDDAADAVDDKWGRAFERADQVRDAVRTWLADPGAEVALAESTHELLVRLLSGLDLTGARPRLVASDGEFHSLRRQLDRLAEAGVEVVRVTTDPVDTLAERMAAAVDDRTAAALVSTVLFGTARIVPHLAALADACRGHGAEVVLDAYHSLGVMAAAGPRSWASTTPGWWAAGYKYLQWGEGNAYMRLPAARRPGAPGGDRLVRRVRRPHRGRPTRPGRPTPPAASASPGRRTTRRATTGRPASREFFADQRADAGGAARLVPPPAGGAGRCVRRPRPARRRWSPATGRRRPRRSAASWRCARRGPDALQALLGERGVQTDSRGDVLRLGPAPYLSDAQLVAGVAALGEAVRELGG